MVVLGILGADCVELALRGRRRQQGRQKKLGEAVQRLLQKGVVQREVVLRPLGARGRIGPAAVVLQELLVAHTKFNLYVLVEIVHHVQVFEQAVLSFC